MNPGIEAIWEDERWRRKQMNESSQFTPCSSQGDTVSIIRVAHSID